MRFEPRRGAPSLTASEKPDEIRTVFLSDTDWTRVEAVVTQEAGTVRIAATGPGNLHAATEQVCRFLSLDIDARTWPDVLPGSTNSHIYRPSRSRFSR